MNRFLVSEGHKFGNLPYDSNRNVNIQRLVSQNIEHNPIIKPGVCDQLLFNPYSNYHLHCIYHKCINTNKAEEVKEVDCICEHYEEEVKDE
jgi:hypothetical protein